MYSIKPHRTIALIPARGGSKRIPLKNIKPFCGKPIIAYSIENALKCGVFDEVIMSTDSEQIAQIAQDFGAKVPFMRPQSLSDDFTPTAPVAAHTADMLGLAPCDLLCVIYPTAPLLKPQTLKEAHKIILSESSQKLKYVFGAVEYSYTPFRGFMLKACEARDFQGQECESLDSESLDSKKHDTKKDFVPHPHLLPHMLFPKHYLTRSQDLEPIYHDAGQFYFGRVSAWREGLPIFAPHSYALLLPPHLVQDIDTLHDWQLAELKYQAFYLQNQD